MEEISLGEGQINVLKYSPKGTFLGLGTSSGDIIFWPALERDENKPIKCSSKGITFLAFNQSENLIAFSDEIQVIGILKSDQLSWKIDARVKVHTKTITGITFTNEKDLFSIGLDRKICHIEDNILKLRRTVDKFSDPILINHCQDFLIIGTSNRQIRFVNPETLLTRRILDSPGIPKAIFQPKFGHCIFICEEGIVIGDSDWPTTVDFWNIASQGLLKVHFLVIEYLFVQSFNSI